MTPAAALHGEPAVDKSFHEGTIAAVSFFAHDVLPKLTAERAMAEAVDSSIMELDVAAF